MGLEVGVKFINKEAEKLGLPCYRYSGDAGADLHVCLDDEDREIGHKTIFPNERVKLPTGVHIELPEGYWGRITHRSSTEKRLRLRVVEGTIDNGYVGPLFVQVHNPNTYPIEVRHGDRLAQLILCPVIQAEFVAKDTLKTTDRNDKGFGSTGSGGSLRSQR